MSVAMVILDWLTVTIFMRVELKFVSIMTGILFVMMDGAVLMLELFVINLDILTVAVSRACTSIIILLNINNYVVWKLLNRVNWWVDLTLCTCALGRTSICAHSHS